MRTGQLLLFILQVHLPARIIVAISSVIMLSIIFSTQGLRRTEYICLPTIQAGPLPGTIFTKQGIPVTHLFLLQSHNIPLLILMMLQEVMVGLL